MAAMLARLVLVLGLLVVMGLSGQQLAHHLAWQDYRALVGEIRQGRFEPGDIDTLAPLLTHAPPDGCRAFRDDTLVVLHFYAAELQAFRSGSDPFLPSDDPDLTAQRRAAERIAEAALACAPMDGNAWLNRAVVARARGAEPDEVARGLALSERFAPHEGWIARRRDQLF